MDIQQAYNHWASQYDTNSNKTRDLEALALRAELSGVPFDTCLEVGCGTGKNTVWLSEKAKQLLSVDFSEEMLSKAKEKVISGRVQFVQADITQNWSFRNRRYDLVVFSLVLEHIKDLDFIFREVALSLNPGGYVYIGELHPFKQYAGSKARFNTEQGLQVLECFTHHISEFVSAARKQGLLMVTINEYFDDDDKPGVPRILTLLLKNP